MTTSTLTSTTSQLTDLVAGVRSAVGTRSRTDLSVRLVADQLRQHLPGPEILTTAQRIGDARQYATHPVHVVPDGSRSRSSPWFGAPASALGSTITSADARSGPQRVVLDLVNLQPGVDRNPERGPGPGDSLLLDLGGEAAQCGPCLLLFCGSELSPVVRASGRSGRSGRGHVRIVLVDTKGSYCSADAASAVTDMGGKG